MTNGIVTDGHSHSIPGFQNEVDIYPKHLPFAGTVRPHAPVDDNENRMLGMLGACSFSAPPSLPSGGAEKELFQPIASGCHRGESLICFIRNSFRKGS